MVLRDAGAYDSLDQRAGQRPIGREADGALGRLVQGEFVSKTLKDCAAHHVETAVVRGRTEGDQHAFVPECRQLVADGLGGVGAAARIASLSFSRAARVGSGSCARYWSITAAVWLAGAQSAAFAFATFLVLTALAIVDLLSAVQCGCPGVS